MQTIREQIAPTIVKLTVTADAVSLSKLKDQLLKRLAAQVKIAGFRPGKAPLSMVERHIEPSRLQSEFVETAINSLYADALEQEKLRPVKQPDVTVTKFVPFTDLEFSAEIEVIGEIILPDYRNIRLPKPTVNVTEKDIDGVIHSLQLRMATKTEVQREARDGDELVIDFSGRDAKADTPIKGADGKGYPLLLGSNTFIPGFESNLIGMKAGEEKSFTLTFPADYSIMALRNRKVTFTVAVVKVNEVAEPAVDDAFVKQVGPFASADDMRKDIRAQLESEKENETKREYENALLEKLAGDTKVAIPDVLVDEEAHQAEQQVRQNLVYRGQTWQEYLDELGQTEEQFRASLRQPSKLRVEVGLLLTEVAAREQVRVEPQELQDYIKQLKTQYTDKAMLAELEKPENVRSIASRMLTEKTVGLLTHFASQAPAKKKK